MDNLRPFQIGLLAAFALIGLISILILASFQGFSLGRANPYGERVVIWGTFDQEVFTRVLQEISKDDKNIQVVQYIEKDGRTFEEDLVNAIAEGRAPDAIILEHEDLVTLRPKLQPIPYDSFPERTLKDNYLDGFEIFARGDGLYAIPLAVDPLLMYWNRDLFAAAGLSLPPTTWEALTSTVEQMTLRDATRNILQGTVAFGDYQNVNNAKAAILTLLSQSGSRLVEEDGNKYVVAVDASAGNSGRKPLTSALQFYVEFSNPSSPLYSWNRTFQSDADAFLGEQLALYFGYGSEASRIGEQNPNLNFDAAAVPQGAGATVKRVYGKFYGFAIVKSSANQAGTFNALLTLSGVKPVAQMTEELGLAPAHRTTISSGTGDAIRQTAFNQALITRGWLDPGSEHSNEVFKQMVEDVVSGRSKVSTAAAETNRRLELAF